MKIEGRSDGSSSSALSMLIEAVRTLPLPSETVHPQLLMLKLEDADLPEKIKQIIQKDPILAGYLLSLANSLAYAGREPVTNIGAAISRIGARTVVRCILRMAMTQVFKPPADLGKLLADKALIEANFLMALAVQLRDYVEIAPEEAYLVGVLHDIGHFVMAFIAPGSFAALNNSEIPHHIIIAEERATFGFDHEIAGKLLCNHWKLPARVTLVVAAHHRAFSERPACDEPHGRLLDLVWLTDLLAQAVWDHHDDEELAVARARAALARLDVGEVLHRFGAPVAALEATVPLALAGIRRDMALSQPKKAG